MLPKKGRGNHGQELSQDVIAFLNDCISRSTSGTEAALFAGIPKNIFVRVLKTNRASQVTLSRIQNAMKSQAVC